ncbi:MAG: alpha/beta hydrolase [Nitriliruptorales bacterium]|nr:alpha/beta hydrolase [Nitriliruptorales bacterium]
MARFVRANRLRFAYRSWGPTDGPLALCLHGFPDHAPTWRHLGPALADAGWRVVAPWMRGYAPTEVPPDGDYGLDTLAADTNALHRALGGDERAVVVGHDWGASAAYRATAAAPGRWRAAVTMAVPPEPALAGARRDPAQLRRSWYMLPLALPGGARFLARDDFALVDRLWREWSPAYVREPEDRQPLRATLESPGTADAAAGYYRAIRGQLVRGGGVARQRALPRVPTLYLHGGDDGCIGVEYARRGEPHLPAGSRVEIIADAGHFLHLERPDAVADRVIDFLRAIGASQLP